jgi:hypothetical protein
MSRIERIWLATELLDMRAGSETALTRVVQVVIPPEISTRQK